MIHLLLLSRPDYVMLLCCFFSRFEVDMLALLRQLRLQSRQRGWSRCSLSVWSSHSHAFVSTKKRTSQIRAVAPSADLGESPN